MLESRREASKLSANDCIEWNRTEVAAVDGIEPIVAHHKELVRWHGEGCRRRQIPRRLTDGDFVARLPNALAKNPQALLLAQPLSGDRLSVDDQPLAGCLNGIAGKPDHTPDVDISPGIRVAREHNDVGALDLRRRSIGVLHGEEHTAGR